MKKTAMFLILFLFAMRIFSQDVVNVTLKGTGNSVGGIEIKLIETSTLEEKKMLTNNLGVATFSVTTGKEWDMYVAGVKYYKTVEAGVGKGENNISMLYNPALRNRLNQQTIDRTGFAVKNAESMTSREPNATENVVKIIVRDRTKMPVANVEVALVNVEKKYIIKGKADNKGVVTFIVPMNSKFDVDVANVKNIACADVDNNAGDLYTFPVVYQVSNAPEKVSGDTIFQDAKSITAPTTDRARYKVTIVSDRIDLLNGSMVYLCEIGGNKVFASKTDKNGSCEIMLPLGFKYMIQLPFQRDVDVVNLMRQTGNVKGSITVTYLPEERLEHPERYLPTVENLFITEFYEFVDRNFPEPTKNKMALHFKWANGQVNSKSKEALLELDVVCARKTDNSKSPKLNICVVLDRSGSMEGDDKIQNAKKALIGFISKLRATDNLSIVIFNDGMEMIRPSLPVGSQKSDLIAQINKIEAGGGTNIYNGLLEGYKLAMVTYKKEYVNRVILLTDGYGADDVTTTLEMSKSYNEKGIDISAVGIGDGYNYALLTLLTSKGDGLFQFVDHQSNFDKVFLNEINDMLFPIAREATVEIEYNNKIVFKQLYGYNFKPVNNSSVLLNIENIYPGMTKIGLIKFALEKPTIEIEQKPIIIRLKYLDLETNKQVFIEEKAYLKYNPDTGIELVYEAEYKKMYCIAIMNQSVKNLAEMYSLGKHAECAAQIKRTIEEVKRIYPDSKDRDVNQLVKDLQNYSKAIANAMNN